MNSLYVLRRPTQRPRAGFAVVLFLLAVGVAASAQAGVVFTSLHTFSGTDDGANPYGALVQGGDGYLYGTTYRGGTNDSGTVFKITTNGVLTGLYSFNGTNDGGTPEAALVQGGDGYFYGTSPGELNDSFSQYGSVFKITTNGVLDTLYSFEDGIDGYDPQGGLTLDSDGNFYGTTSGTIFNITTNGALTTLPSGLGNGFNPQGPLALGNDGNFYGTTYQGGDGYTPNPEFNTAYGTVFKRITNTNGLVGKPIVTYTFPGFDGGGYPADGLIQAGDGCFYGTTSGGYGAKHAFAGDGTVFKITTNLALTTLHVFTGALDGAYPRSGLVQGEDGNFYGTTSEGGVNYSGTIFKINSDGSEFTTLYSFSSTSINSVGFSTNSDGALPRASLILVGNTLYGTATYGGIYGDGTVFSLTLPGPQLNITPSGAGVVLSWPTNTILALQFTLNLGPAAIWNTNSTPPVIVNGQNVVTDLIAGSQMFYRLSR